jgi:hypothetical protein
MKLGRFTATDSLKDVQPFKEFLASMKILREQPSFTIAGATEYLAEFDDFEDLDEGGAIPEYMFEFTKSADGTVTRETRRL